MDLVEDGILNTKTGEAIINNHFATDTRARHQEVQFRLLQRGLSRELTLIKHHRRILLQRFSNYKVTLVDPTPLPSSTLLRQRAAASTPVVTNGAVSGNSLHADLSRPYMSNFVKSHSRQAHTAPRLREVKVETAFPALKPVIPKEATPLDAHPNYISLIHFQVRPVTQRSPERKAVSTAPAMRRSAVTSTHLWRERTFPPVTPSVHRDHKDQRFINLQLVLQPKYPTDVPLVWRNRDG